MAAITTLYPAVLAIASQAPEILASRALIESAREFCSRTRLWREDLTALDSAASTASYTLTLPADSAVVDLMSVKYNTENLTPKDSAQLDKIDSEWRTREGTPVYYKREGTDGLRLVRVPATALTGAIEVYAALKPAFNATSIDDTVLEEHQDTIVNGALARLLRIPKKEWSDKSTSEYYRTLFERELGVASSRGDSGRTANVARKVRYGGL